MPTIDVERTGRVLVARFDVPPLQLITTAFAEELERLVIEAESDDAVGAVVLTGVQDGPFLAHGDVARLLGTPSRAAGRRIRRCRRAAGSRRCWSA